MLQLLDHGLVGEGVGDERVGMMLVLMVYFFMENGSMSRDVLKSSGMNDVLFLIIFFFLSLVPFHQTLNSLPPKYYSF